MSSTFLIADDHVIVRRGLRNLLSDHIRPQEVREVATVRGLVDMLAEWVPDVLILDLQMSDGSALDVLEAICKDHPAMKVLVYSMRAEHIYAQRVRSLGSVGYLSKESSEEEVVRALRRVLQGLEYVSPTAPPAGAAGMEAAGSDPFRLLSDREIGVMEDLLEGRGTKEIAMRLGVQPSTVATFKARLFEKLGVSNLLDLQRLVSLHRQPEP
jgi:two-component system invasion response regulator UvrY